MRCKLSRIKNIASADIVRCSGASGILGSSTSRSQQNRRYVVYNHSRAHVKRQFSTSSPESKVDNHRALSQALSARDARWARIFQVTPWIFGFLLCSIPIVIYRAGLQFQKKNKSIAESAELDEMRFTCRGLEILGPQHLIGVFSSSIPSIIITYRSDTFHSQLAITMIHEIGEICRSQKIPIRIIGVNLTEFMDKDKSCSISDPEVPDSLQADIYAALEKRIECPSLFCVRNDFSDLSNSKNDSTESDSDTISNSITNLTKNSSSALSDSGKSNIANCRSMDFNGSWAVREVVLFILGSTDLNHTEQAENILLSVQEKLESEWNVFEKQFIAYYFCGDRTVGPGSDENLNYVDPKKHEHLIDMQSWQQIFSKQH